MPESSSAVAVRELRSPLVEMALVTGFVPVALALKPDEEDVFCPHCGTRNPPGSNYCTACGKSLTG